MKQITFERFILLEKALTSACRTWYESSPKPSVLAGHRVPDNLNEMTLGQLAQLSMLNPEDNTVFKVSAILLNTSDKEILRAKAVDVIGFIRWVGDELDKVMKLFKSTEVSPTPEEKEARMGLKNAGIFGIADWYAQRMGYRDHEEVFNIAWPRIYKCMEIDSQNEIARRRLNDIYSRKIKNKRK